MAVDKYLNLKANCVVPGLKQISLRAPSFSVYTFQLLPMVNISLERVHVRHKGGHLHYSLLDVPFMPSDVTAPGMMLHLVLSFVARLIFQSLGLVMNIVP